MPTPLIVSQNSCQHLTWNPPHDVHFAADKVLIPLHAGEMAKAASTLPLAFYHANANDANRKKNQWQLVAVCGMTAGQNVFVRQGKWLGRYVPGWLTTWPFYTQAAGDKSVVLFDRESGLLNDAHDTSGEAFFDAQGQLMPAAAKAVNALQSTLKQHNLTNKAVNALARMEVLTPWSQEVKASMGIELDHLYMADEKALAALDDASYLALRRHQAIGVAYGVNFSLHQAHLLARLARLNPRSDAVPENLDTLFEEQEDITFDFDS